MVCSQTFGNNIYIGEVGTTSGSARFIGTTSGYVVLKAPDTGANQTYILLRPMAQRVNI